MIFKHEFHVYSSIFQQTHGQKRQLHEAQQVAAPQKDHQG
jgi:hypothetical protein